MTVINYNFWCNLVIVNHYYFVYGEGFLRRDTPGAIRRHSKTFEVIQTKVKKLSEHSNKFKKLQKNQTKTTIPNTSEQIW